MAVRLAEWGRKLGKGERRDTRELACWAAVILAAGEGGSAQELDWRTHGGTSSPSQRGALGGRERGRILDRDEKFGGAAERTDGEK